MTKTSSVVLALALLSACSLAVAGVTPEEAAKLKTTLTPLGGERAANKEGTIPAWNGGWTRDVAGPKLGDIPTQLFAQDKPTFQITSKNVSQYADKLSEGAQALLKKYPDTFRLDVYETRRTAAAPEWINENTFKNATRCKSKDAGLTIEGCYGGIPFPIPKEGVEAIWNHQMRIEPESKDFLLKNVAGSADGSWVLASVSETAHQHPYYYRDGSPEKWSGDYRLIRLTNTAPPFKAGESLVIRDSVDVAQERQAWQYLVGQRRVRRAPTVAYDTPDFVTSGANYFDEVLGFMGGVGRFDWKLIGKRELYIPYNNNALLGAKIDEVFGKNHLNPDKVRWELHRVWEVEATVANGKRHAVQKRRYYFDEDTWIIAGVDSYDSQGKLWRTSQILPFVAPAIPAVVMLPSIIYNLQSNSFGAVAMINEGYYRIKPRRQDTWFTGDALAADGAR